MDKLIVRGLPPLDGIYEFDVIAMLTLGDPAVLTNREGHRIKTMSGIRAGEMQDALAAGDNDVLIALAAIVLTRARKTFDESRLWDAPMGTGVVFEWADREDADDVPPALPPLSEPPSRSGGESSQPTSAPQVNGQSPIGVLASPRSATSGPVTSGI